MQAGYVARVWKYNARNKLCEVLFHGMSIVRVAFVSAGGLLGTCGVALRDCLGCRIAGRVKLDCKRRGREVVEVEVYKEREREREREIRERKKKKERERADEWKDAEAPRTTKEYRARVCVCTYILIYSYFARAGVQAYVCARHATAGCDPQI